MSSYQIKSTPYFQRMLSKSKRNGELQRLKEDYERIKDFNDHTIALRIKQVRLRRLFREIQDINTAVSSRPRAPRTPQKTYAQMRAEELSRARELGTEYSRENAMGVPRYDAFGTRSSMSMLTRRAQLDARPSSTARRLQYGNSISAYNMKKFKRSQIRSFEQASKSITNGLNCVSSGEIDKMERLHERVDYNNSAATEQVTQQKHNNSMAGVEEMCPQQQEPATDLLQGSSSHPDVVKNYKFVLDENGNINIGETALEYITTSHDINDEDDDDEQYVPFAKVLRNVPQLLRNLKAVEGAGRPRFHETHEIVEEDFDSMPDEDEEENTLRKIPNDRNLPLSSFRKFMLPAIESFEDAQIVEHEQLVKISKLDGLDSAHQDFIRGKNIEISEKKKESEHEAEPPAVEQLTPKAFFVDKPENEVPSLKKKPLPAQNQQPTTPGILLHQEVNEFVKLYEPFPPNDEVAPPVKENFESGVAKLRSIFEHQGE